MFESSDIKQEAIWKPFASVDKECFACGPENLQQETRNLGSVLKLGTLSDHQGTYPPQRGTKLSTPLWGVRIF